MGGEIERFVRVTSGPAADGACRCVLMPGSTVEGDPCPQHGPFAACGECVYLRSEGPGYWEKVCAARPKFRVNWFDGIRRQQGFEMCCEVNKDGLCGAFERKQK